MKRFFLSLIFVVALCTFAHAQESEFSSSGGAAGAITAGVGSGTIHTVPKFASATSVVDSKLVFDPTVLGRVVLYDNTAVAGVSQLLVRNGAGQGSNPPFTLLANDGTTTNANFTDTGYLGIGAAGTATDGINIVATTGMTHHIRLKGTGGIVNPLIYFEDALGGTHALRVAASIYEISDNGLSTYLRLDAGETSATPGIRFGAGSTGDAGWYRRAAGILGVTTGDSTAGLGSIRAANLGVETANGAISNVQTASEEITLSLVGTNSDSSTNLLPANSIILSVTAYVTTLITGATDWNLTDTASANRFMVANATLAAGTTGIGLRHLQGSVATDALGPIQTTADKVRIVTTGTPTAGKVRVTVTYISLTPPTS